jgi:bifunctional oligoribonuclease and PAP phosphatase NrnA
MFKELIEIIATRQRFILTTHQISDGDGMGCELALYRALKKLGKEAIILNHEPVSEKYRFMDPDGIIQVYDPDEKSLDLNNYEVLFSLDNSYLHRLGRLAEIIPSLHNMKISIDHHVFRGSFADISIVDETASCVGEIIYRLIKHLGVEIDYAIAEPLYISVVTDTGYFSYPNTTPEAHLIVAELMRLGIDANKIHSLIYMRNTLEQAKLLGLSMETLKTVADGRLAYFHISLAMCRKTKMKPEETEFFIDFVKTIDSVEVIAFFRQVERNKVNISLRSKTKFNIEPFAKSFGGGGHAISAGMLIEGRFKQVIKTVTDALKKELVSR